MKQLLSKGWTLLLATDFLGFSIKELSDIKKNRLINMPEHYNIVHYVENGKDIS